MNEMQRPVSGKLTIMPFFRILSTVKNSTESRDFQLGNVRGIVVP